MAVMNSNVVFIVAVIRPLNCIILHMLMVVRLLTFYIIHFFENVFLILELPLIALFLVIFAQTWIWWQSECGKERERRSEPDRKREKKEETGRAKKSALVSLHKFCFSAFRTNDVSFVSDETASNQRCFAACTNEAIIVPMSVFKWNKTCATNTWSHKIIHQIKKTKNKINLNISKRNHQM